MQSCRVGLYQSADYISRHTDICATAKAQARTQVRKPQQQSGLFEVISIQKTPWRADTRGRPRGKVARRSACPQRSPPHPQVRLPSHHRRVRVLCGERDTCFRVTGSVSEMYAPASYLALSRGLALQEHAPNDLPLRDKAPVSPPLCADSLRPDRPQRLLTNEFAQGLQ
jgi:hypothetical protein